jgi:medium-chain acyl-[acyl-carrier-protein] hydrolase
VTAPAPWFVGWRAQTPESRTPPTRRIVCLPYAGGGAALFRSWVRHLDGGTEIWAARLPGRESRVREPGRTDLRKLANELAEVLAPALPASGAVPFAVFGYSLGALIAYELTSALQRLGAATPALLAVGGHDAPNVSRTDLGLSSADDETLVEGLRQLGGTPHEVLEHPELRGIVLPAIRADFTMLESYRHGPSAPIACPLATYTAVADPEITPGGIAAWQQLTGSPVRHRTFPGGHFFLDDDPAALIRQLEVDAGFRA